MSRAGRTGLALAAMLAVGAGGFWAGQRGIVLPVLPWLEGVMPSIALAGPKSDPSGQLVYYRDPDGRPNYSAAPRKTADGRDFLPVHASEDVSFDEKPESPKASGSKRVLYFRNPMGLPDVSPVPKKDSMGMDYIPVYEGDDSDGSDVTISPGKLQRTGVRSEAIAKRAIIRPIRVPGTVKLDERLISVVVMRSDAFVETVADVTTGDRIAKGQTLMRLYSPEIAAASARYLADMNSAGQISKAKGSRQRLENLDVPAEAIAEIERARKVPLAIAWTAPRDGVVIERNVVEGMKAAPGDVLFRIADISTVWVVADVPEYELGAVKLGDSVSIRLRSRPGQIFNGRVALIYPVVNKETRTTKVRIEISNQDRLLLPDMYADVEIATGEPEPVIAVPDSAIIDTGARQVVIIDKGNGRFEPRDVKIGMRGDGFTEIRTGVAEGDKIVVAANFLIDAESNLKAALTGMDVVEPTP